MNGITQGVFAASLGLGAALVTHEAIDNIVQPGEIPTPADIEGCAKPLGEMVIEEVADLPEGCLRFSSVFDTRRTIDIHTYSNRGRDVAIQRGVTMYSLVPPESFRDRVFTRNDSITRTNNSFEKGELVLSGVIGVLAAGATFAILRWGSKQTSSARITTQTVGNEHA